MISAPKAYVCSGLLLLLAIATLSGAQKIKETSIPLGDALDHALKESLLTGVDAKPFHLKLHLFESTNPASDYRAEIEEYWLSSQQWRRTIDTPDFKQTLVVNGEIVREQDTGDYYPLWLKNFITAISDPVPNADQWNKANAKISRITLPNGQRSEACARVKFQIGSETVKNDAFGSVCFDNKGLLKFVGWPGYGMEFHDYRPFGKKMVARRYQDDPEPGTELVANVTLLEEYKNPDASFFTIGQSRSQEQQLRSVPVSQAVIEQAARDRSPLVWPSVQSGRTEGLLSMYISVDRQGQVREAYPLNSDNAGLQDAARDQLLKWKLKPMVVKGVPVQAEAALSFHFITALSSKPTEETSTRAPDCAAPQGIKVSPGVMQGFVLSSPAPEYPPEAKAARIQGKVVLGLTVDRTGTPQNIRVLSSPLPAFAEAAISAVRNWRYQPYRLNGCPVAVEATVEVNFTLP